MSKTGATMKTYDFNLRASGIFADGFVDRDGKPVRDTFVYQLRAKIIGVGGLNWSKAQNAALAKSLSSTEMDAIMSPMDHPHVQVEYNTSFYGGNHSGQDMCVHVPEALIDLANGDVVAAFATMTRIDPVHVLGYCSDRRFDGDGTAQNEPESPAPPCA